ncbi:hypothetical protein ACO34A_17540 [Rhizobium sp. ACO-34A]|nr:hypothetical protein ACO34A_17540 [Rhizobium sp. ACO-34A]
MPGISPSRGEIGWLTPPDPAQTQASLDIGEDKLGSGEAAVLPISPLEGEMPGRAEGGNPGHHRACPVQ